MRPRSAARLLPSVRLPVALLLLLGLPAASSAETWFGTVKGTSGCYGLPLVSNTVPIVVTMPPGAGEGVVVMNSGGFEASGPSDRILSLEGKGELFAITVSNTESVISASGTIKGRKLIGTLLVHDRQLGCVTVGKVKAKLP